MRYFPPCEVLWKIEKLCLLEILEEEAGKFQYELSGVCCSGNPKVSVEVRKSTNYTWFKNIKILFGVAMNKICRANQCRKHPFIIMIVMAKVQKFCSESRWEEKNYYFHIQKLL